MKEERIGTLVIEGQKHLQEFTSPNLRYYQATLLAGQVGRFLGKIRGLEVIHDPKVIDIFLADVGAPDKGKEACKYLFSLYAV